MALLLVLLFLYLSSVGVSSAMAEKVKQMDNNCTCEHRVYKCHNIKDRLPPEPRDCKKPMVIEISASDVKTLSKDTFDQTSTKYVTRLTITNCSLAAIQPDAFKNFPNLTYLILTNNNLSWAGFSKGMKTSLNLTVVHLDGNPLGKIAHSNFHTSLYRSLRNLTMKNCHINVIESDAFENFSSLTLVNLNKNNLTTLEFLRSFDKTGRSLRCLYLSNNTIKNISVFSGHDSNSSTLSHLEVLSLDGNPLDLQGQQVFAALTKLEELSLQNLKTVSKFPNLTLPSLKKLRIRGSSFTDWTTDTFLGLTNLEYLNMKYINLSGLSEQSLQKLFLPLSKMKSLTLSKTGIKGSIGNVFKSMPLLQNLQLDHNHISNITGAFSSIQQMNSLLINNNKISVVDTTTDLPQKISHRLDLSENPFHCTCALVDFRIYLSSHWGILSGRYKYICHSPKEYAGKPLFDFNPRYSDCHGFNPYVVTAIVVCVVLIVVVLAVSLVNSNKHRIRRYWNARKLKRQYTDISKGSENTC